MKMKRRSLISIMFFVLAVVLTSGACEKDGSSPKGSGDLTAEDKELFKLLPTGSTRTSTGLIEVRVS